MTRLLGVGGDKDHETDDAGHIQGEEQVVRAVVHPGVACI